MRLPLLLLLLAARCAAQGIVINSSVHTGGTAARTGNPVTMVFERTQTQTLADGIHVTSTTHEWYYRDSAGRMRSDHESPLPARSGTHITMVMVQDPVARFILHWQTGSTGNRQPQFTSIDMDEIPRAQAPRAPAPQASPDDAGTDPPLPTLQRDPPRPRVPREPAMSQAQDTAQPRQKTTIKNFGMQDVQGVPCEASVITTVYPVGFMGNDRPITATTERCVSREFGRAVRELVQDPRNGTRTLTLQSVTRGEPDPMLFHPPADYEERSQTP